jgi:hypothetical protein
MPKRQNLRRFPSDELQGEGSYVEVSRLTVGEAREADRMRKDPDADSFEAVSDFYQKHVHGWNWVDDDGKPLPLPRDDPAVVDALTDLEFAFIGDCLAGSEEERKNS